MPSGRLDKYHHLAETFVNDYKNGITIEGIAEKYKLSSPTVRKYLRTYKTYDTNKSRETQSKNRNVWHGKEQEMVSDYNAGRFLGEIQEKFSIAPDTLRLLLKSEGVSLRSQEENNHKTFGYVVNENAFADFSEEKAAYYYGHAVGDACLTQGDISYCIHADDREILDGLKEYVGTNASVRVSSKSYKWKDRPEKIQHRACFLLSSRLIVERFISQGYEERKSLKEKLPPEPLASNRHFWRGVADSDGHVGSAKYWSTISIVGSKEIVEGFYSFCSKRIENFKQPKESKRENGLYVARLYGKQARFILRLLYTDCEVFLTRKRNRALHWIENDLHIKPSRKPRVGGESVNSGCGHSTDS